MLAPAKLGELIGTLRLLRPSSRPHWAMQPRWYASAFVDSLLFVLSALERRGVEAIAHKGLLLGAHRLGGLLPWDDDADVFTVDEDRRSLARKLEGALHAHGFRLEFRERDHYYWAFPRTVWRLPLAGLIELGLFTRTVDAHSGRAVFDAHDARRTLTAEELFPLRRYPFYGSYVYGPRAADVALERMYGELAESRALRAFQRPAIDAETDAFWSAARPIDGALDWERISHRFMRRKASRAFQLVQGPCSAYWIANRCWWHAMDGLRVVAGGPR